MEIARLMVSQPKPHVEVVGTHGLRSSRAEVFSIICGGPLYRLLVRLGVAGGERPAVRALALMSVCWLPLLILSLAQRLAYDHGLQIPFVRDFAVNVRSGLVKVADLPSFEAALKKSYGFAIVSCQNW